MTHQIPLSTPRKQTAMIAFVLGISCNLLLLAAESHAAKKISDTYPAVENESPEITNSKPTPVGVSPERSNPKTSKKITTPPKKIDKTTFDPVPPEQIEGISRRLQLVDRLLRKYGRAYDYRIHTLKELEAILTGLEGPAAGDAAPESESLSQSEL